MSENTQHVTSKEVFPDLPHPQHILYRYHIIFSLDYLHVFLLLLKTGAIFFLHLYVPSTYNCVWYKMDVQ